MTKINTYIKLIIAYVAVFLVLFSWWRAMIYSSENDFPLLLIIIGYLIPIIPIVIYSLSKNKSNIGVSKNEISGGMN